MQKRYENFRNTRCMVKQKIVAFCRSNGLHTRAEPTNIFRIQDPDDNKRPDIEIRGLPTNLLLDVTVVSPLYSDLSIPQSRIQGRAAARAVITKNNKYEASISIREPRIMVQRNERLLQPSYQARKSTKLHQTSNFKVLLDAPYITYLTQV